MTRRVLILGATSGIAQETSRCFAAEHARLFLVARDPQKLTAVAEDLKVRGAEAVETHQADLAAYGDHPAIIHRAASVWQGLDAALIAHGSLPDQTLVEKDSLALREALDTNYFSALSLSMQLATVFEEQHSGVLAIIGSVAGDRGRRSNYVYGSAKAAMATFAAGLRLRLLPAGVKVVLIKPGWVSTPMTEHLPQNFLYISAEKAGRGVYKAITSPSAVVYLPSYWKWIMAAICTIPEPIFAKLNL
jgi:decaprenylphospho-beta-D-erythro-pentofuranosid-2-ulose 2-reductase